MGHVDSGLDSGQETLESQDISLHANFQSIHFPYILFLNKW